MNPRDRRPGTDAASEAEPELAGTPGATPVVAAPAAETAAADDGTVETIGVEEAARPAGDSAAGVQGTVPTILADPAPPGSVAPADVDDGLGDDPAFATDRPGAAGPDWDGAAPNGSDEAITRRPSRAGRRRRPIEESEPDNSAMLAARQAEATAIELRLAHLHLRTGAYDLARIQLEGLVGKGRLDERGLIDLAESRWRSGDLTGAADAVDAYLAAGGEAPIGFVIAAEARSAEGRPSDARRFAREAMDRLTLPLEVLFAGQPRSSVWPHDPAVPAPTTATLFSSGAATAAHGGRIGVAATATSQPVLGTAAGPTSASASGRTTMDPAAAGPAEVTAATAAGGAITAESVNQAGGGFWDDDGPSAAEVAAIATVAGSRVRPPAARETPAQRVAVAGGADAAGDAQAAAESPDIAAPQFIAGADPEVAADAGATSTPGAYEPPEPTWLLAGAPRTTPPVDGPSQPAREPGSALRPRDPSAAVAESAGPPAGESAAPAARGAARVPAGPSPFAPDAHVELERARHALREGDLHGAAARLAMALRLRPSLAPIVLDLAGDLPGPDFDLVRGDALRLVGRESAAQQAYASAMSGLGGAAAAPPASGDATAAPPAAAAPPADRATRSSRPTRAARPESTASDASPDDPSDEGADHPAIG